MGSAITGMTGELADSLDRHAAAFEGGVAIRWPRTESSIGIQTELLYTTRSRSFPDVDVNRRQLNVTYLQIPLLARTSLKRTGRLRPYVLAGPHFAWRRSSEIDPGRYVGDEPVDPRDVRRTDAGATFGLGSDLVTASGRATLEVRVGLGFVDLLEDRAGVDGAYRVLTILLAFSPTH